ncbi:3-deoxy-manno-octulosonate cytidylyltransferase [Gallaecimonas xiamenensis]|uniref:3-deoxy-manno-octulosonate cytidylyltransferase n=1 Tax=Gallaecimonas xiamenensis 3-C-1 TaxID=745411 RepID=K2ILM5_9GAMM|nr:3-deoxy-manno-octulosonate cytidylyltransferase [Gallaecimonas xiamenensis]EKE71056.1 3-deoxy-manno-octulosonate cytidylyltransferase [Gallaecimonas xiamenensis 3-C-1]
MNFLVVIPARYASTRLPGKPLLAVAGKPMVLHVLDKAQAAGAQQIWVATDDDRIQKAVQDAGGQVMMTRADHESGTDRLAEVAEKLGLADDTIVVNVQGDEPLVPPAVIAQVAQLLADHPQAAVATLATPIEDEAEAVNPNAVKVVTDKQGFALYFSRASIPAQRNRLLAGQGPMLEGGLLRRHLGIYAYRAGFLRRYTQLAISSLEQLESLEQLRVLWHGERIIVADACQLPPAGIDTQADLDRVNQLLGH